MMSNEDKALYLSIRNQSTDQVGEYLYNAWFPVKDVELKKQHIEMLNYYDIVEKGIRTVRFKQK